MGNYVKTPTVYQMEATECGAASLSMVFGYFGKFLPLEQMRIETGVSRDGCNAGNIMRCAKKYGLEVHGYRKEPEFLKEVAPPCIIHWNFNHFVVFEGFKDEYAYLNDPAVGRRKLTYQELDEGFTGVVLTFALTDAFEKQKKVNNTFDLLKLRLKGQYATVFQLVYIGLLLVFPGLVLPVLSQVFMDDILVGGYTDWLTKLVVFMVCLVALQFGLNLYRSAVLRKLKSKLTLLSGYTFIRHMLHLPMSFYDQRYTGDITERINDNTAISDFIAGDLGETVLNVIVAVFYFVVLIFYSPLMSLVAILNMAVCMVTVYLSNKKLADATMRQQIFEGKLSGAVCAGLGITDTIKASGAESEYTARVLGFEAKTANQEQETYKFQKIVGAIPNGAGKFSDAVLLLLGGILCIKGKLTLGMLLAFNSLFDSFCDPIYSLMSFVEKLQTLKANLRRTEDIEKYEEDIRYTQEDESHKMVQKLSGEIELKDISFGYSALKPPLIENFSFHLNCGESIAFVGPSGCGKSTISKVVSGLYHPWSGEILADGIDLTKVPKSVLNASISTVSQNITLFSGSIRDNLTLWNKAVTEEKMIAAAKDACIHDFISTLNGGYDYILDEGASNLSGGQRQRLEIARALATNPTILIMDEATSALDPIVEKQILDNLKLRGCTCIIVAHRLSAIRDCNQIVVMRDGKIIQRGTHKVLSGEEGYYREFVRNI